MIYYTENNVTIELYVKQHDETGSTVREPTSEEIDKLFNAYMKQEIVESTKVELVNDWESYFP